MSVEQAKTKRIHFVGIKGVGMTPLAIIAKEAGCVVTGSDIDASFITDASLEAAGIAVFKGFSKEHITDQDLVITTGAHGGYQNVEVVAAKDKHIHVVSQGEAVGLFMQGVIVGKKMTGISVAGSHGKTTTTALLATVLKANNFDPSYVVGTSSIPSLGGAGHFGSGEYFIAEADEYVTEPTNDLRPKLHWHMPQYVILTNIEFDHPDVYASVDAVREAFVTFVKKIPDNGFLVTYGDDPQVHMVLKEYAGKYKTYGFSQNNDFVLTRVYTSEKQTFFSVNNQGAKLGEFVINVPGEHNALNALSVISLCLELGLSVDQIKHGLLQFTGSKRRFEYIGMLKSGAAVYDDYAHHPTEIKKTLAAMRQKFPHKKIICIFQPHTFSRTKELFQQFAWSFSDADTVIMTDIYASLREEHDPTVSSKLLIDLMQQHHKHALFLPMLSDVVKYLDQKQFDDMTVVITMGAGNVYQIADSLQFTEKHGETS